MQFSRPTASILQVLPLLALLLLPACHKPGKLAAPAPAPTHTAQTSVASQSQPGPPALRGPRKPVLLWRHDFGTQTIVRIMPGQESAIYVGLEGNMPGRISSPVSDKQYAVLMAPKPFSLSKLDSQGKLLLSNKIIGPEGKAVWDTGLFAQSLQPDGPVYALTMREYSRSGADQATPSFSGDSRDCQICAIDGNLLTSWRVMLPDTTPSGPPIPLPDGSVALDMTQLPPPGSEGSIDTLISSYDATGSLLFSLSLPPDPGSKADISSPSGVYDASGTLSASPAGIYAAREEIRLLKLDSALKVVWSKLLAKRIRCRPVLRPDGTFLLATTQEDYSADAARVASDIADETGETIRCFDRAGNETWTREITGFMAGSLATDSAGNIYYLTRGPDGREEAVRKALDARSGQQMGFGKKPPPPLEIERNTSVVLHKASSDGTELWSWSQQFKSVTMPALAATPVVDSTGACYLWVEDKLVAVNPDGSQLFLLDLDTIEKNASAGLNQLLLSENGRIYLNADGDILLCIGDKPAGA